MKVLVCGSSGLVGSDLCALLRKNSIDYVGIHNSRPMPNSYKINIFNTKELNDFLDNQKPTVCINCIADRNVDTCETSWEQTRKINTDLVSELATVCRERNIFFIHISTDYVFDGRQSPYTPSSQVNPLQIYGITKFLAECRIQSILDKYCIVRVPVLYTNTYIKLSDTAVTVLAKKVMNTVENTKEDNYSIRRPVFIPDLCCFLLDCIQTMKSGVYHFYNPSDKTTKYEMCQEIGKYLQRSIAHIHPINDPPSNNASRPYDTNFTDDQYDRNIYPITQISHGISLCFKKYWHPSLYEPDSYDKLFLLIDLDGTLVDTDILHYRCYAEALSAFHINLDYTTYSHFENVDKGLKYIVGNDTIFENVKTYKRTLLHNIQRIKMISGAEQLLQHLVISNIEFAVVTNTGKKTVDHFKSICPPLQSIKNWITREDYNEAKPSPECFQLAIKKFHTNQPYIIGIENNLTGFKALKYITNRVYIISNPENPDYNLLKKEDCYLIKDLTCLYTNDAK